ncbi:uncharacterized protein DSM5745_07605 [Aspergillus mulundensis]|uniref:Uncharacterized protein n=1 Tax=Aspergillus mulundensis TaxID=1810919 RepID=A0A3D8REE4_9EURO|nr:hypothetical protein DSM5745_07605 [Aspergillus mulundensis]RDW72433.1 hypothetical protein DSM5745_07605 [Aspergillus mulundensis]
MSADQLLYPVDFSVRQDEWLDFDALLQLPTEYLESNPTSVESISPRDLDQTFTDTDFLNWDSDPAMCSQAMFPDFVGYEAPVEGLGQAMDFQPFINPNDVLQTAPPLSNQFVDPIFDNTCLPDAQDFASFRYMVESQAAMDPRCFSQKEKRRDASIALHLQRMQEELVSEMNTPSLSSNNLSSPNWSELSLEMTPAQPSTAPSTSPAAESQASPRSLPEPGAPMQLVLDLNMNTTTNVPKKQKPRSKAQRENYIKARKYGVCEKHRKQHKRCNCLEKAAAAHLNVNASLATTSTRSPQTNHERILLTKSPQRSVQNSTGSTNIGLPRPVREPVLVTRPDLSPTQPLATAGRDQHTIKRPVNAANTGGLSSLNQPVQVTRPGLSPTQQSLAAAGRDQHVVRHSTNVQKPNVSPTLPVQTCASPTSHNRGSTQTTPQLSPTGGLQNRGLPNGGLPNGGLLIVPALFRHKEGLNKHVIRLKLGEEQPRQQQRQSAAPVAMSGSRGTLNVQNSRVASTVADATVTIPASTIVRQTLRQSVDTMCPSGSRGTLNVQNSINVQNLRVVDTTLVQHGSTTARQTLPQSADKSAAGSRGTLSVQNSRVVDTTFVQRATTAAHSTAAGLFSLWQGSSTLASSARQFFSRVAVFSSKLYIQYRKGMGLI